MKFSWPSDHVTKLCFLEAVVSAGREPFIHVPV